MKQPNGYGSVHKITGKRASRGEFVKQMAGL